MGKGLKYDEKKLRLDLIPFSAYESLGKVLTFGANKYTPNSWQMVEKNRYVAALLRHMVAYLKDPNGIDEESGLLHVEHLFCNAMFLNHFQITESHIDSIEKAAKELHKCLYGEENKK